MTGGIGFTKLGQTSNRNNRNLQKGRTKNTPSSPYEDPKASHYDEAKAWNDQKIKRQKQLTRTVFAFVIGVIILATIITISL